MNRLQVTALVVVGVTGLLGPGSPLFADEAPVTGSAVVVDTKGIETKITNPEIKDFFISQGDFGVTFLPAAIRSVQALDGKVRVNVEGSDQAYEGRVLGGKIIGKSVWGDVSIDLKDVKSLTLQGDVKGDYARPYREDVWGSEPLDHWVSRKTRLVATDGRAIEGLAIEVRSAYQYEIVHGGYATSTFYEYAIAGTAIFLTHHAGWLAIELDRVRSICEEKEEVDRIRHDIEQGTQPDKVAALSDQLRRSGNPVEVTLTDGGKVRGKLKNPEWESMYQNALAGYGMDVLCTQGSLNGKPAVVYSLGAENLASLEVTPEGTVAPQPPGPAAPPEPTRPPSRATLLSWDEASIELHDVRIGSEWYPSQGPPGLTENLPVTIGDAVLELPVRKIAQIQLLERPDPKGGHDLKGRITLGTGESRDCLIRVVPETDRKYGICPMVTGDTETGHFTAKLRDLKMVKFFWP